MVYPPSRWSRTTVLPSFPPVATGRHHHLSIRNGENGLAHRTVQIHGSVNAVLPRRIESPAFARLRIAAAHHRHSTERTLTWGPADEAWRRRLDVRRPVRGLERLVGPFRRQRRCRTGPTHERFSG